MLCLTSRVARLDRPAGHSVCYDRRLADYGLSFAGVTQRGLVTRGVSVLEAAARHGVTVQELRWWSDLAAGLTNSSAFALVSSRH